MTQTKTQLKISDLAKQRDHLVAQIAYERALIVQNADSLRRVSRAIDKVKEGLRYFKQHPEILLLPAGVVMVTRPYRLWKLAVSSFGLWRMIMMWRQRIHRVDYGVNGVKALSNQKS